MGRENTNRDPHAVLTEMLSLGWLSTAISVAARLRLADRVAAAPQTAEALAPALGLHPDALYRLLRSLALAGIFRESPDRTFTLGPLGRPLLSEDPGSLRPLAALMTSPVQTNAWAHFDGCLKTGESGVKQAVGVEMFDYLAVHPEEAEIFNAAMTSNTAQTARLVLDAYDFASARTVVDVGGGRGGFLFALLKAYPTLRGILYDLPEVIREARSGVEKSGVSDRLELFSGSFLEGVPLEGDLYLMKNVLWNWGDEDALSVLFHVRRALKPGGRALIVETLVPAASAPPTEEARGAGLFDLVMLVMTKGGRARTEAELKTLLERAELRLTRVIRTKGAPALVEATLPP